MDGGHFNPSKPGSVTLTPSAYRDAMAEIAGQVHVVTTAGPAGTSGFTAIAVASVSDEPPTLLVCLNAKSANGALIEANGCFAVNPLAGNQSDLAETFAGRRGLTGPARFDGLALERLVTGAPLIAQALAGFDCTLLDIRQVATHRIIIGRVEAVRLGPGGPALSYFRRGYRPVTS